MPPCMHAKTCFVLSGRKWSCVASSSILTSLRISFFLQPTRRNGSTQPLLRSTTPYRHCKRDLPRWKGEPQYEQVLEDSAAGDPHTGLAGTAKGIATRR